tara:strand:+ start:257 stop:460 length:204 start_codon:yes stop_codon:yes gene_type:complete
MFRPFIHRNDLARVVTLIAQVTDLPSSVDNRDVVLINDVIYTIRTIKAALEALHLGAGRKELRFLRW